MAREKYISIAIQDPGSFIDPIITRNERLSGITKINLELVRRVESEIYSNGMFPTGRFGYFNRRIKNEEDFKNQAIIKDIGVKLAGNGHGYLVGGYIHSGFFFSGRDIENSQLNFPLHNENLSDIKFSTRFFGAPQEWSKSNSEHKRNMYQEGVSQLRVCLNTDYERNITNKEERIRKEEGLFVKSTIEEIVNCIVFKDLKKTRKEAYDQVLKDIIRTCNLIENGVNSIYECTRRNIEPLGELELTDNFNIDSSRIIIADDDIAQSYTDFEFKDENKTRIYVYFSKPGKGIFKIRSKKTEEGQGTETKVIERTKTDERQNTKISESEKNNGQKDRKNLDEITFGDIVGATEAKNELLRVCDYFKNPEDHKDWGIKQKAGALLYGPSGTGKTLLARAFAQEANADFILCKSTDIIDPYVGKSDRNLQDVFEKAKNHERCVLVFDEFDSLGRNRKLSEESSHGTESRLVNIILSFLDGFERQDNVYLIGTTNYKDIIDNSILQRLDIIEVPLPNDNERAELIRKKIEKHKRTAKIHPFRNLDYEKISEVSEDLSGRELVGDQQGIFPRLLSKAREKTKQTGKLYEIETEDWLEEISRIKPVQTRKVGF